jgi:thioredoxin reductase (NADPH)
MEDNLYDVIIIGSGPAGLTAGIYMARGDRKTLIVGGRVWGGQLMLTTLVENFPGFADGIMGPELMRAMRKQAENQGAQILDINFKNADFSSSPFTITTDDDKTYNAKSLLIATGANTRWLDVPGEKERIGRGVSSCAPCDAAFYRNKNVIVVGGGDSAMEEALVLTKFASHVYVMHRRDSLKASAAMVQKAYANEKISFIFNSAITEIMGNQKVESVLIESTISESKKIKTRAHQSDSENSVEELGGKLNSQDSTKAVWELPIDGVFVAIGHMPNSEIFKGIEVDANGFIKVFEHTKTNIEGVFVGGDVHDAEYKQAITAAAFGCMAALETEKWLQAHE